MQDEGFASGPPKIVCIAHRPEFAYGMVMQEIGEAQTLDVTDDPEGGRRRGRLHHEAAKRLREMILSGELPPGMRLREVQLCKQLGVSRTPIREAFRTLAAEGLVALLPNRSVVVAELRRPDIEHMYRVFGALEGLAGELACQRVTEAQIAEMGRLLSAMVDLHQKSDRGRYMEINRQIHRMVIDIAGNPVLTATWQSLVPRVERARAGVMTTAGAGRSGSVNRAGPLADGAYRSADRSAPPMKGSSWESASASSSLL